MSDEHEHEDEPLSEAEERLLADLGRVVGTEPAPAGLVARAEGLLAYADLERELVELLDSAAAEPAGSRGVPSADSLIFELGSGSVSLELRVRGDAVVGQLLDGRLVAVTLQVIGSEALTAPVDALGRFSLSPAPRGPARLLLDDGTGRPLATDWFVA